MSILSLFRAAGPVRWPLLLFSVVAIALVVERGLFWANLLQRQPPLVKEVLKLYRENAGAAFQRLRQNPDLPIARMFMAALELERPTPEEFRAALESAGQAELPLLRQFNTVFDTVITTAPLFGLLGTVQGLIVSFSSLQLGSGDAVQNSEVTGGIATALVSTAFGLIVAITISIFGNLFRSLYRRQRAFMEDYGNQLERLYRDFYCDRGNLPQRVDKQ
jgi:biopolymer transport protein ExbB